MPIRVLLVILALCPITSLGEDTVDYLRDVKPILQSRCYACHGALKHEANLRLDTAASAARGGDSGAAIQARQAEESLLVRRVAARDEAERMPPEGEPLTPRQIRTLKLWIDQGATAPADETPEPDPREHWAFQTPVRPNVPTVQRTEWIRNPIDAFIAAAHEQHGLKPQPRADKRILLRRVYLDLVGLPPTRDELESFAADKSPDAYEQVVLRLLNSPQYGERWGRHWMDIWRYSDWWGLGAEVRNSQKHIWHWRDWIIESLNTDVGYDQMVREMLAADELYPTDLNRLRASGYLARQYFKFNRTTWLDETIEHTSKAFLGLTLNCAKCHDHKYDPFAQQEYYRLRAVFEPYQVRTDLFPGEPDVEKNGIPRAFDCNLDAQTFLHIRGDDRNPDKNRVIEPGLPQFLKFDDFSMSTIQLPPEAYQPGLRPFVVEDLLKLAERRIAEARKELDTARKRFAEAEAAMKLTQARAVTESASPTAMVIARDDFSKPQPDLWEMRSGDWSYSAGKLIQKLDGPNRGILRLKSPHPADFMAKLRFVTTGGRQWKSVGITFDVTESNEVLAYLSAVQGGSKSQVSYKQPGYIYPPEAAQAREVRLNTPYELTLRVRGPLVNVSINGDHSIAYRLPISRQPGHLELITFDAQTEFLSFELAELPASELLVDARAGGGGKPSDGPLTIEYARLAVTLAEKSLAAALLEPGSLRARAAADRARFAQPPAADAEQLAHEAARAENEANLAKAEETAARAELDTARASGDKKAEAEKKLAAARATVEAAQKALATGGDKYTSIRGSLKTLESNLETEDSRNKPFPTTSTGRRSALARWMTDPRNPLTARVAVNHIWSRHFGRPLVPTVFDFGRKGSRPTHPELLDWLACEFMEPTWPTSQLQLGSAERSNATLVPWSMKHLHWLMVTSNTYRMTSSSAAAPESNRTADADNRHYWRMNPTRMEAQLIRDSLLQLAGELDLTIGGPSVPINDESSRRRSLYFVHSNNDEQRFLTMFDNASVQECYRRAESIVPQQALALENSRLALSAAEKIAQHIQAGQDASNDEDFIRFAYTTILASIPTHDELDACRDALRRFDASAQKDNRPNPRAQVRRNIVHSLLNHNDFVTIR